MKNIAEIKFDEIQGQAGNIGLITLSRPKALNALNHEMCLALNEQLLQWNKQATIKAVIIQATTGRAFCAGGDIRYVYENKHSDLATQLNFFRDEYRMNLALYHFSKPYIALLNGITMGGGAGISIHGSYRIGTENLVFAMPETAIGFFPDVGMTYRLARLPNNLGLYLGLTGNRINAADCLALGLIQALVSPDALPTIITKLSAADLSKSESVSHVVSPFIIVGSQSKLMEHALTIEDCFAKNSVEEIIHALENHATTWSFEIANQLKIKSPTSLKVTFAAIKKAEKINFAATMQMEYGLAKQFIQHPDFFEGVRAALVDKDQKPQWQPNQLELVSAQEVADYFLHSTEELVE